MGYSRTHGFAPPPEIRVNRIIAVTHDATDADNRCTRWLTAAGYDVTALCPAAGADLPPLDSSVAGVVIFGGRYDVTMRHELPFLRAELAFVEEALRRDVPYLGICLGGQMLAQVLGAEVNNHPDGFVEYGYYDLRPTPEAESFVNGPLKVLQAHWQGWYETPPGAVRLAYTENFPQQAFRHGAKAFGLQFHPEATKAMLEKWLARRPAERHAMKGAFQPDRQRQDFLEHDAALGSWFHEFLSRWMGPAIVLKEKAPKEAAE